MDYGMRGKKAGQSQFRSSARVGLETDFLEWSVIAGAVVWRRWALEEVLGVSAIVSAGEARRSGELRSRAFVRASAPRKKVHDKHNLKNKNKRSADRLDLRYRGPCALSGHMSQDTPYQIIFCFTAQGLPC